MELIANEILGAYQLGLLTPDEARVALGFPEAVKDEKESK